jgi:heme-degrading monooxygenase HmoA
MILRMWKGRSSIESSGEYVRHATQTVFPKLRKIGGHRGAYLLRRPINGGVEFVVLMLWDSMEAVRKFAGGDTDEAVVEPEARSVLSGFDDFVTHFDVIHGVSTSRAHQNSTVKG